MSYEVKIKGVLTDDDGWEHIAGKLGENESWWDVPLPQCPDCGGDMVWYEAGYVPGTRKCMGAPVRKGTYREENSCGSMYNVTVRDGFVVVRRERFYR